MFFFFNDTATTEIYTLSLHDALPIFHLRGYRKRPRLTSIMVLILSGYSLTRCSSMVVTTDRKSTRLNSSHANISYAVFCLKKKKIVILRRRLHPSRTSITMHHIFSCP